jgi:hypothetical protein
MTSQYIDKATSQGRLVRDMSPRPSRGRGKTRHGFSPALFQGKPVKQYFRSTQDRPRHAVEPAAPAAPAARLGHSSTMISAGICMAPIGLPAVVSCDPRARMIHGRRTLYLAADSARHDARTYRVPPAIPTRRATRRQQQPPGARGIPEARYTS